MQSSPTGLGSPVSANTWVAGRLLLQAARVTDDVLVMRTHKGRGGRLTRLGYY